MPSFEETNQADQDNPDFQYKPGTQGNLETSDVVVEDANLSAAPQEDAPRAPRAQRSAVPAELKPDVLDASLPLPKPAPLQRNKVAKAGDPNAAKKPNLRSRWKTDPAQDSGGKAHNFGAVDDLTDVRENLSGRSSRSPQKRATRTTDRPTQDTLDEQQPKRPRNARGNGNKRSHAEDGDGSKRSERSSATTKRTARKQARKTTSAKHRRKQPTSLLGKIVHTIQGLFGGGVAAPEPEPSKSPRQRPSKKSARNNRRRRPGGKATDNAENNADKPPAKKRSRRRRRNNNQRREGGHDQASKPQSDPS